jgi:hypothetical protein
VRVIRAADPEARAHELLTELDGELIRDEAEAERAVTARVDAGRTEAIVLDPDEETELRAQAALQGPSVDAKTLHELRRLADELGRADRIRLSTETSLTEELTRRMSNGSSVSIHPASLREAAGHVAAADIDVRTAEELLDEVGDEPVAAEPAPTALSAEEELPDLAAEEAASTRRRGGFATAGVLIMTIGIAAILVAVGAPVIVALVVVLAGLVAAFLLTVRQRHDAEETVGLSEGSSALASATAHITMAEEEAEHRAVQSRWLDEKLARQVVLDRATEKARSARRQWESLAGPDADPYDIEGVLRARDPQYELLGIATKASPTVRTANALHRAATARWKIAWASLGHPVPPTLDEADLLLARFGGDRDEAATAEAVARLEAADAWSEACKVLDRTLVLVEPSAWLPEDRLESLLLTLPAGADAVIVEGFDPEP